MDAEKVGANSKSRVYQVELKARSRVCVEGYRVEGVAFRASSGLMA